MHMKRKSIVIGLVLMLAILFVGMPMVRYMSLLYKSNHAFVTGIYSKYCYQSGKENKNIKVKIYYESLSNCGKPLKSK